MVLTEGGSLIEEEKALDSPKAGEVFTDKFMELSPYKDLEVENSRRVEIDNLPAWILGDAAEAKKLPAWFAKELGSDTDLEMPAQAMVRVKPDGKLGIGLAIAGTLYEGGNQSYGEITEAIDAATSLLALFCEKTENKSEWEAKRHDKSESEKVAERSGQLTVSTQKGADQIVSELIEAAIRNTASRWDGERYTE